MRICATVPLSPCCFVFTYHVCVRKVCCVEALRLQRIEVPGMSNTIAQYMNGMLTSCSSGKLLCQLSRYQLTKESFEEWLAERTSSNMKAA